MLRTRTTSSERRGLGSGARLTSRSRIRLVARFVALERRFIARFVALGCRFVARFVALERRFVALACRFVARACRFVALECRFIARTQRVVEFLTRGRLSTTSGAMSRFVSSLVRRFRGKKWGGWLPPIALAGC